MEMKAIRTGFGEGLVKLGKINEDVVVLDADLSNATKTIGFAEAYPERFFNCGIAEANMIDISVGMSRMGKIPFCSTFALFCVGRGYEMIRNSVAYPKCNVKICGTHAGITVGKDGGSHQTIEDIALMRVVPGMTIICPCDANEAEKAVMAAAEYEGPVYLRLARGPNPIIEPNMDFKLGKANVLRDGNDLVLFACGIMVATALECASEIEKKYNKTVSVVNIHTIKPLDEECVVKYAEKCRKVAVLEEHSVIGGLGDAVMDLLINKPDVTMEKIGINDCFGQSGDAEELLEEYGLSFSAVEKKLENFLEN